MLYNCKDMRHMFIFRYFISIGSLSILCFLYTEVYAQSSLMYPIDQSKSPKRQAIDKERETLWYFDKDGLKKSKTFIHKDSTYYVGYLYEGAYKYFHAEDKIGYRLATKPLEKARRLLEKDYNSKLKTRSADFTNYFQSYRYQEDFCMISYLLEQCYSDMEESDKALEIMLNLKNKNLQKEYYIGSLYTISWIYHRNRMHTQTKYPFLKNSIRENDSIALLYLDSAILRYQKNLVLNRRIFYPNFIEDDLYSIFHYKALIYSYSFQIDSAEYYYQRLMEKTYFPDNNYGHFKLSNGEIATAEYYFKKAQQKEPSTDKRIKESNYMLSIIDIYKSKPQESIGMLESIISAQGSTPGYGWHQLALARSYFYAGDTKSSLEHVEKAGKFEELHIGTTWIPEQYNTMVMLLKYANKDRQLKALRFEHDPYWLSGTALRQMPGLLVDKYILQLALANGFATNPEREMVTYRLFSSESLSTFDEVWFLIRDFNPDFFLKKFQTLIKTDPRKKIAKYYRYFIAKLLAEQGYEQEAKKELESILQNDNLDPTYEKLFLARIYETLAEIAEETTNARSYQSHLLNFYKTYPQLVPFSSLRMKFKLNISTKNLTESEQQIITDLKNCRIDWSTDSDAAVVNISFPKNSKKQKMIYYEVISSTGETYISRSSLLIEPHEETGKKLAYCLFDIHP